MKLAKKSQHSSTYQPFDFSIFQPIRTRVSRNAVSIPTYLPTNATDPSASSPPPPDPLPSSPNWPTAASAAPSSSSYSALLAPDHSSLRPGWRMWVLMILRVLVPWPSRPLRLRSLIVWGEQFRQADGIVSDVCHVSDEFGKTYLI